MQVVECYQEKNKKTKELEWHQRLFGEAIVCARDLLDQGRTQELMYQIFDP